MNVMSTLTTAAARLTAPARSEVQALVDIAAQTVSPLWPLDSAIAVNPLSGFEGQPFEQAVQDAAALFGARASLPLHTWRRLMAKGRIEADTLRKAAVDALGGLETAFAPLGPDLNGYDLLMARLTVLPVAEPAPAHRDLSPGLGILSRWLAAFFDCSGGIALAGAERGLYGALVPALQADPALRRIATPQHLPPLERPEPDALGLLAAALGGIAPEHRLDRLKRLFALLPGWSGHLRWRTGHADPHVSEGSPATMADLAALIALVEGLAPAEAVPPATHNAEAVARALLNHWNIAPESVAAWPQQGRAMLDKVCAMNDADLGFVFMTAAERSYLGPVAPQLEAAAKRVAEESESGERPRAQLVFCIDVRSEPFRRALERQGGCETFGYAGFFGLPVAIQAPHDKAPRKQLPVLLSPSHHVAERPVAGLHSEATTVLSRHACLNDARRMLEGTKGGATGFAAAEATGPMAAIVLLARTLAPRFTGKLVQRLLGDTARVLAPHASNDDGHHDVSDDHATDGAALSLDRKVAYARAMFSLTGLKPSTARLVALVGHGGCTTNNPFAASLDCGACGGHPGGPNARLMAAILNEPAVRAGLAQQGVELPSDTWFVAAQHDTTRDIVHVFDAHLVPASHTQDLAWLNAALESAGEPCRAERARRLGRPAEDLLTGALHWAEVRPEWGLSGNAAFIVGPRALTAGTDLEGTAFLHSYDWREDTDGSALTTIMTAPMIVAQWINCQYLFSTLDNAVYGAGDKTTLNVAGSIGVVQGGGGDLCTGLPQQSLFGDYGLPFHIPRRLSVIIEAPLGRVEDVVTKNEGVRRLVENGWINLMVIDPWKHRIHHWQRNGRVPRVC